MSLTLSVPLTQGRYKNKQLEPVSDILSSSENISWNTENLL